MRIVRKLIGENALVYNPTIGRWNGLHAGGTASRGQSARRPRSSLKRDGQPRRTANLNKPFSISLHFFVLCQPDPYLAQYACSIWVRWIDDSVMHPLGFPPRANNARLSQICQVSRDARLISLQDLH